MNKQLRHQAGPFTAAVLLVLAITYTFFSLVHVNPTTVGFAFLLAVLVVAAVWGLPYAIFTAVVATLAYNYCFLPPVGRLTIADPQNWVALAVFLTTAIIASHLSDRARREALKANRGRHEVERLYAFSQQLLASDNALELLNAIPGRVVDTFGLKAAAILLGESAKMYYSDLEAPALLPHDSLQTVAARGEPAVDSARGVSLVPLRVGVRTVGSLGVIGVTISRETLDAAAGLIAIAIERSNAVEKLTRTEAARESEKLRTALLDSVTHEFRTPLTSILASTKNLLGDDRLDDAGKRELLSVIDEEGERLNRLVGEAAEMAQLDAHQVELHLELHNIRDAIEGAVADLARPLQAHPVDLEVPDGLPFLRMDVRRIQEVITHLLDNAAKYSPPGTPLKVTAERRPGGIMVSVADSGPGIDDFEQPLIFEKFYRGRGQRGVQGTGMGLPIVKAIVEAHGGTVGVTSQLGHGSVFSFQLPESPG